MSNLKSQIESALGGFWDTNVVGAIGDSGTVDDSLVPLDSISACEVLLDIEAIVKRELPVEKIVKKGGYETRDTFIAEVTKAVLEIVGEES